MTADTQTLSEWLLVQIGADEARASIYDDEWTAHVLAVCEAHRRIVEQAEGLAYIAANGDNILRALAAIYADRDGFREEWR